MFHVIFYEDRNGNSPVVDFIDDLDKTAHTDKNSRVRLGKIIRYISLLEHFGTRAGLPASRHIEDGIWELRPLSDRFLCVLERRYVRYTPPLRKKDKKNTSG